jgi:NAD+ kinase
MDAVASDVFAHQMPIIKPLSNPSARPIGVIIAFVQERFCLTTFNRIGILAHPLRPPTAPVAEHIARTLRSRNIQTWLYTQWQPEDVEKSIPQTDLVVAIGGDGAMLRAARVCAPFGVPVLGVNMGHLGFLTEIDGPESWDQQVDALLADGSWIEERMMICAKVVRNGAEIAVADALNDVVISRGVVTRTVQLETYIDKDWATTYNADALVIATATGSTAYALASGGPILPPELRNILIVPVAPHLSMDRPIVLSEGAKVEVVIANSNRGEVVVTVDGELITEVRADDRIRIRASDHTSRFLRLRERHYFYRSLLDRLEPRVPLRSQPDQKQI